MKSYDPNKPLDPAEWLALEESEQMELAAECHRKSGTEPPRPEAHAMVHVVVENQLAEEITVVQEALERLMEEGLDRHEAIHAIAAVLLEHLNTIVREKAAGPDAHERYFDDLRSLTVEVWHERCSEDAE